MIIGVTGGIASGKSEVCRILEQNGFTIIDADIVAHDVLEKPEVIKNISEAFGNEILCFYDNKLCVDRKKLGNIVFSDKKQMDKSSANERFVRKGIHNASELRLLIILSCPPSVDEVSNCSNNKKDNFVIEAIKLVSSGLLELCDELWIVHTEPEQQIQRMIKYRNMSYEEALARIKLQDEHDWDEKQADRIIYSTEPIETMRKQVTDILKKIL